MCFSSRNMLQKGMARIGRIVFTLFISCKLFAAGLDGKVELSGRSYPVGGSLGLELGYKQMLWGEEGTREEPQPWQGYLRPYFEGDFAPSYLSAKGGVEVFPLGFLGARAASGQMSNHEDYKSYNCTENLCREDVKLNFIEGDLALGVPFLFIFGRLAEFKYTPERSGVEPVVEPEHGVRIHGSEEVFLRVRAGVGSKFDDGYTLVFLWTRFASNEASGDWSESGYLEVNKMWESFMLTGGLGAFNGSFKDVGFSSIGRLSYTF